jgi:hypothetical protein
VTRRSSVLQSAGWLALAIAAARPARAAEADAYVQLHWQRGASAASCPEQPELEQLVRLRLGRDPFGANAPRTIEASIDFAGGAWHVELHVRDATGPAQGQRVFDVRVQDCAQVADAVGLAVALAIDPNASIASLPAATAPSDAPREQSPYGSTNPVANPAAPPQYIYPPLPQPLPPLPEPFSAQLTLRGMLAAGLLPGAAPGLGVAGAVGKRAMHVTLGLSYFPEETARDARFSFGMTVLDAGMCGDMVRTRQLVVGLCGEAHAGAVHSVVTQLRAVHPGDSPYVALSAGPKVGLPMWAPFYLDFGAAAWAALKRPTFMLTGGDASNQPSPIYEVKAMSVVAYVGFGWTSS